MGYLPHSANQGFITSLSGERLYLYNGTWSRPYVVPDWETEQRLFRKQQASIVGVMAAGFLLQEIWPVHMNSPWIYPRLAVLVVLMVGVRHLIFRRDLATLRRLDSRISGEAYLRGIASSTRTATLKFRLTLCLFLVALMIWSICVRFEPILALILLGCFGYGIWAFSGALAYKCKMPPELLPPHQEFES